MALPILILEDNETVTMPHGRARDGMQRRRRRAARRRRATIRRESRRALAQIRRTLDALDALEQPPRRTPVLGTHALSVFRATAVQGRPTPRSVASRGPARVWGDMVSPDALAAPRCDAYPTPTVRPKCWARCGGVHRCWRGTGSRGEASARHGAARGRGAVRPARRRARPSLRSDGAGAPRGVRSFEVHNVALAPAPTNTG